jgi:putative nucleotidyltransferase with HDIG domain
MIRILFADDEPPVLDGLRTRLYRQNGKWEMVFVDSGSRAIAEFERRPFDVIVSDMRMPGMDGAELLKAIGERWPEAVRLVLSGYAEPQQVLRLVPIAHQYLSKPCDAQRLVSTIDRCLQLRALLPQADLRALVGRVRALPLMPRVHSELQAATSAESVDVPAIAELVASDPIIAAKILQMTASAFFRLARPITNIDQAVSYLGVAAIRSLAHSPAVFASWPETGPAPFANFEELQVHSHAIAAAAHELAAHTPAADESLLAGLLHNIGYWVLAHECPEQLAQAVDLAVMERIPLPTAERRVIGASHAEVGAYLLGIWGLPPAVVEAVAHHHSPNSFSPDRFGALGALAIAMALVPSDEASTFGTELITSPKVDATVLTSFAAPFTWPEAMRRVSEVFNPEEAVLA